MSDRQSNHSGVYTNRDELLQLRYAAKDLNLSASKRSTASMEGNVRTRYRGRGMEFAEVRQYQPGDDIRTIDWRVTARMQSPYTKLFQEERERPIFVMVDQRSSMFFGSVTVFKSVFAARMAALVAWVANLQNDRIGALVFGDTSQQDIRAKRSKHAVLDLLNRLVDLNSQLAGPIPSGSSISTFDMLTETSRIARPGSLVILLSDFQGFDERCPEPLTHLSKTSDVLAIHVFDPLERVLPPVHHMCVSNGHERANIHARQVSKAFTDQFEQRKYHLKQSCLNAGVQYVAADLSSDFHSFAQDLFGKRKPSKKASLRRVN